MKILLHNIFFVTVVTIILGLAAGNAGADLSYDLKYVLNGNTSIDPADWLTVSFSNAGTTGQVLVAITSNMPVAAYYISNVAFNVDPSVLLTGGSLSYGSLGKSGSFQTPSITIGENTQNVPGGGNLGKGFDVMVNFASNDGTNTRFGYNTSGVQDDALSFILQGYDKNGTAITENSFYPFFNSPSPDAQPHSNVGAHVAGLPGSTSSLISNVSNVPIPHSVWLLGSGLPGLLVMRRMAKRYIGW